MTSEQAAQIIEQQQQLLELYRTISPLLAQMVRDLFPLGAVAAALLLGVVMGVSAT